MWVAQGLLYSMCSRTETFDLALSTASSMQGQDEGDGEDPKSE
jgi:hypothetical protein